MGTVHCPFCGAGIHVAADGSVEPQCPRCGAWAMAGEQPAGVQGEAALAMAIEARSVPGPAGEVRFLRAPYAGEPPGDLRG